MVIEQDKILSKMFFGIGDLDDDGVDPVVKFSVIIQPNEDSDFAKLKELVVGVDPTLINVSDREAIIMFSARHEYPPLELLREITNHNCVVYFRVNVSINIHSCLVLTDNISLTTHSFLISDESLLSKIPNSIISYDFNHNCFAATVTHGSDDHVFLKLLNVPLNNTVQIERKSHYQDLANSLVSQKYPDSAKRNFKMLKATRRVSLT